MIPILIVHHFLVYYNIHSYVSCFTSFVLVDNIGSNILKINKGQYIFLYIIIMELFMFIITEDIFVIKITFIQYSI